MSMSGHPSVGRCRDAAAPVTPELAAFQDEPPQMRSGAVGKTGFLHLGFERRGRHTVLARLERRAPYMAQRAFVLRPGDAGLGVGVSHHDQRLRLAGRPARSRREAWSRCAGARYHAVGNQDSFDGRQLCGANAEHRSL